MKYSLVVPYWNAEEWIGRCCDSLISQSGDFEFIFVNDSSTDNGEAIVNEYANRDERFVMLDNERRKGVSGARNTGIGCAEGGWITFLDADDEWMPDVYKTFENVIRQDKRANIIQLNHLRYYTMIDKLALKYTNEAGVYGVKNLPDMWFGVWNKLFRAEFLSDIRFDEDLLYGEDGLFVLECVAKDNYIYHAAKRITATKHRFDNKDSLSHVKDAVDLIRQCRAYEDFIMRQTDPDVRQAVCDILSELWSSGRFRSLLGDGKG